MSFVLPALLLAACGGDSTEKAAFTRAWSWSADREAILSSVALLPNGEVFVGQYGGGPTAVFLASDGKKVAAEPLGTRCDECGMLVPSKPVVLGDDAIFGDAAGGEPLLRIELADRFVGHLPLQNPLNLPTGTFVVDARVAAIRNGKILAPGGRLTEISRDGFVTDTHPSSITRAVAHLEGDRYVIVDADGVLAEWSVGGGIVRRDMWATHVAGGAGGTFAAVVDDGVVQVYRYGATLEPVGPTYEHHIELAAAAGRVVVGVTFRLVNEITTMESDGHEQPGTVLVFDADGSQLGKWRTATGIKSVDISPDGKRVVAAHEEGVVAFDLR